jgi:hypothetical protein
MGYFKMSNPLSGLNGDPNGATYWILQSQENRKKVFSRLKEEMKCGNDPNEIFPKILEEQGLILADFTPFDVQQLITDVERYWREI